MIEEFPNLNDDPKEENEKLPNNEEVENFSDNSEEYNSDIIEFDYEELSKTVSEIASVGDNDDVFKEIEENQKKRKKKNTKEEIEEETKSLYAEFNEFLETKLDIKSEAEQKILIPTKLDLLDAILGGGFSAGTMAIITGSPGSFKSTLLAQVIASAQAIYAEKLLAAYMDSEEACSMTRLANLGVRNPTIKPKVNITVEKVFKLIEGMCRFKEYKKIKNKLVSQAELKKVKNYIKGQEILSLESCSSRAIFYANQELSRRQIIEIEDIFKKIDKVTAKDIQDVAKEIFVPEKLNLAIIGKFKNQDNFRKLLKI